MAMALAPEERAFDPRATDPNSDAVELAPRATDCSAPAEDPLPTEVALTPDALASSPNATACSSSALLP